MPIPNTLQAVGIALLIGLVVGAGCAWRWTSVYKDASWRASTAKLQVEAAAMLREAQEKAMAAERAQSLMVNHLEVQYAMSHEALAATTAENRALVARLGGLRDPGRGPSRQRPVPDSPAAAHCPAPDPAPTELSTAATDFLLDLTAAADEAALYARTCHAFVDAITTTAE